MNDNTSAFLKVLDPNDNSTGGGTASAVAGAMAAALVAMVARLSLDREGSQETSFYQDLISEAEGLAKDLFTGGRKDSEAFKAVSTAYKLPNESDPQKIARQDAIQRAMIKAAHVPLANAEKCRRIIELFSNLQGRFNPNTASDLECAGHLARAGLAGCIANVEINLPYIDDQGLVEQLKFQAETLRKSI